jgi:hypothetical protein
LALKITLDPVHTNSAYKQQHCYQSYSNVEMAEMGTLKAAMQEATDKFTSQ